MRVVHFCVFGTISKMPATISISRITHKSVHIATVSSSNPSTISTARLNIFKNFFKKGNGSRGKNNSIDHNEREKLIQDCKKMITGTKQKDKIFDKKAESYTHSLVHQVTSSQENYAKLQNIYFPMVMKRL